MKRHEHHRLRGPHLGEQPQGLREVALRTAGWQARRAEVMSYLKGLQGRYGFGLLDCSDLASFGGDPDEFYDGFHMKRANARKLTRSVVARLPASFADADAAAPRP
jgi:hypothetical protein